MSKKINDLNSLTCLQWGTLPVREDAFRLVFLGPQHIDAIQALHDEVIDRLPEDQKSFVLPRARAYFESQFRRGHGSAVLGVVCNGELVAKCLIVHPEAGETTATLGGAILHAAPQHASIFQSSTVHPGFRGNGIMNMMIQHWMNHAKKHKRTHVQAEIETRNAQSWNQFLKAGLNIVGAHKSPVDGARVYNAAERIKYTMVKDFTVSAETASGECIECPSQNIAEQMEKFTEGFVAVAVNRAGGGLIMKRR